MVWYGISQASFRHCRVHFYAFLTAFVETAVYGRAQTIEHFIRNVHEKVLFTSPER